MQEQETHVAAETRGAGAQEESAAPRQRSPKRWYLYALLATLTLIGCAVVLSLYESYPPLTRPSFLPQEEISETATRLRVGAYVMSLSGPTSAARTFDIDLYLWIARPINVAPLAVAQTADQQDGEKAPEEKLANDPWLKFEVMNGSAESQVEFIRERDGDEMVATWHIKAKCQGDFLLGHYPFDTQELRFAIEHPDYDLSKIALVHEPPTVGGARLPYLEEGLSISGWKVLRSAMRSLIHRYNTNFGMRTSRQPTSDYSRIELTIEVGRDPVPFLIKSLVPLILVMMIGYLVAFLHHDQPAAFVGILVTCLLTTVALHLAESVNLGEVGYLTSLDKFFIFNYVALLALFIETIGMHIAVQFWQNARVADFLNDATRLCFPLAYLGGVAMLFRLSLP